MTKILYFNRETLDQRWLDDEQHRSAIKQFEEAGYMPNPPLEHMWNPRSNEFRLVHIDDAPGFEDKGYVRNPAWVYHPTEGGKMVSGEEAKKLLANGWYDNPGKFPGNAMGTMRLKPKEVA